MTDESVQTDTKEINTGFDWRNHVIQTLQQDTEYRKQGIKGKLFTLDKLDRTKSWDFSLPTLLSNGELQLVASGEAFLRNFYSQYPFLYKFDEEMRKHYEEFETNYYYAGGSISRNLTLTHSYRSRNYDRDSSDVDIFFQHKSQKTKDATRLLQFMIITMIRSYLRYTSEKSKDPKNNTKTTNYRIIRNKRCITLILGNYTIQFILRLYQHKSNIIYGFDLGSSAVLYDPCEQVDRVQKNNDNDRNKKDKNDNDNNSENNNSEDDDSGDENSEDDNKKIVKKEIDDKVPLIIDYNYGQIYFTVLSKFAYEAHCNIVDTTRRSTTYEKRIEKNRQRGFSVILPQLEIRKLRTVYHKYGRLEICELPYYSFTYSSVTGNKIKMDEVVHLVDNSNDSYNSSDYQINNINGETAYTINLTKINKVADTKEDQKEIDDDFYYHKDDRLGLQEKVQDVIPYNLAINEKQIINHYDELIPNLLGRNFPHKLLAKYVTIRTLAEIATKYFTCETKQAKLEFMTKLIEKQKKFSLAQLAKYKDLDHSIQWQTKNPGSQLTSSFNPIIEEPVKWYGKYMFGYQAPSDKTGEVKPLDNKPRKQNSQDTVQDL